MDSTVLTNFLNAYFEWLARPLFDSEDQGHLAYTDKIIGDAIMNIFEIPAVALKTTVEMRQQLAIFNSNPNNYFREAPQNFRINIGSGLAYGIITLGVIGHSRRMDYSTFGDTVNLASRLEALTKFYHSPIIVDSKDGTYTLTEKQPSN